MSDNNPASHFAAPTVTGGEVFVKLGELLGFFFPFALFLSVSCRDDYCAAFFDFFCFPCFALCYYVTLFFACSSLLTFPFVLLLLLLFVQLPRWVASFQYVKDTKRYCKHSADTTMHISSLKSAPLTFR